MKAWTWFGLVYGIVLFLSAFGAAGGGHGSYLPFGIYCAPLSILPVLCLFAPPLWWVGVDRMLALPRSYAAIKMLAVHAIATSFVLLLGPPWSLVKSRPGDSPAWFNSCPAMCGPASRSTGSGRR